MLNQFLRSIVEAGHEWLQGNKADDVGRNQDLKALCSDLLKVKGEASSAAIAHDIVQAYEAQDAESLEAFFGFLLSEFDLDPDRVVKAALTYKATRSADDLSALMIASEARRQDLFRRINQARNGTAMLVDLRGKLVPHLGTNPDWKRIDLDLRHLLSSWFNRGFLRIARIDWHSPAAILEKIMHYETVHVMSGWNDLRRRLADDRRCYAFFHPALPEEPLIFVEVALVNGLTGSVAEILDKEAEIMSREQRDTAIFYSINDCQIGLRGISFGDFLIKQVVAELQIEFPDITIFSTLSPIPGFQKWLGQEMADESSTFLSATTKELLSETDNPDWISDGPLLERIEPILKSLCAHYLLNTKRSGKPLDPVARFHLRNGAELHRINWLGDLSKNGLQQSRGLLVNYVYNVDKIEKNHENFVHHGQIAASDETRNLADSLTSRMAAIEKSHFGLKGAA